MIKLLAVLFGLTMIIPSSYKSDRERFIIDRAEGNYTVVEFSKSKNNDTDSIVSEDANISPICIAEGKFYGDKIDEDYKGDEDIYYQFRSDDDTVYWILTAEEIGHVPNTYDKYTLYYLDNGTTEGNRTCDCPPDWDCECYVYDDVFLYIEKRGV